tara:strand:+ start:471 stop:1058 length:588 start_codon:yes stop_codon:yes gene_type:complete
MPYYCGYCNVEVRDYGLGLCMDCLRNLKNIEDEIYIENGIAKKYKCAECKDTGIYYRDYPCSVCYIEPTEEEMEVSRLKQLHEKELLKQKQQHEKELLEQKNKSGIIYLIQPCELVETKRYKVGMSKNTSLDRVKNGYKKGSRYLCIMEVKNPVQVEKNIIKVFNETYKIIAGKEYYQIDVEEKEMIKLFINTIL